MGSPPALSRLQLWRGAPTTGASPPCAPRTGPRDPHGAKGARWPEVHGAEAQGTWRPHGTGGRSPGESTHVVGGMALTLVVACLYSSLRSIPTFTAHRSRRSRGVRIGPKQYTHDGASKQSQPLADHPRPVRPPALQSTPASAPGGTAINMDDAQQLLDEMPPKQAAH
uniref:Uncharacterized protein n=1 Tax=Setaria viridis TaxID=4556 RepID=A0A4U6VDT6_SETVI|nr:hypothetical protein SEVIR_3G209700v2 [Setaria viridis]